MNERRNEAPRRHRLFHAMVVMGSSLALGCAGKSVDSGEHGAGGSGGSGPAPGGTGSTMAGSGGSNAGSGGAGGSTIIPVGGTAGTVDPGPFICPPETWDCAMTGAACSGDGYYLPENCACDDSRPRSPADCDAGESFVCLEATYDSMGQTLSHSVPFDCKCLPSAQYCEELCDQVGEAGANCYQTTGDGGESILCGCAVIVLR